MEVLIPGATCLYSVSACILWVAWEGFNSVSDLGRGVSGRGRGRGMRGRSGRVGLGREGHHHCARNVSRNKHGSAGTSPI